LDLRGNRFPGLGEKVKLMSGAVEGLQEPFEVKLGAPGVREPPPDQGEFHENRSFPVNPGFAVVTRLHLGKGERRMVRTSYWHRPLTKRAIRSAAISRRSIEVAKQQRR